MCDIQYNLKIYNFIHPSIHHRLRCLLFLFCLHWQPLRGTLAGCLFFLFFFIMHFLTGATQCDLYSRKYCNWPFKKSTEFEMTIHWHYFQEGQWISVQCSQECFYHFMFLPYTPQCNLHSKERSKIHRVICLRFVCQAAQKNNMNQFAITTVTVSVHLVSLHPPVFDQELYRGVVSAVGSTAVTEQGPLRFSVRDEDYPEVKHGGFHRAL